MSISVADVLKLPSMRGAQVIGGKKGLSRIVSSISVLEYAQINAVQTELFENIEFLGNELAITGFLNNPDDVELQCMNIRRLAQVGEVGMILFYVGVVMKRVDQRLIDLANELDFVLICMPLGQKNQRYSEVICEVMELIHRDQMNGANLVSELLEQAASLPAHRRTVDSMLRMLSNRLRASVVLMDSSRRVLNEAAWPLAFENAMKDELMAAEFPALNAWKYYEALNINIYRNSIQTRDGHCMDLLIFREGDIPDVVITRQLVRAILQDEPMKMRRLADIFNVDVASINSMWLISGETQEDREKLAALVEVVIRDSEVYSTPSIADIYDGELVLFLIGPDSIQDVKALTETIGNELAERGIHAKLIRCHALNTTTRVREAYLIHQAGLRAAKVIFPGRWVFTLEQISFAQQCHELIGRGERAVEEALRSIDSLLKDSDAGNLLETLERYLLDAGMSVTRTSEQMYLHKNTIKYRIHRIADHLGFEPGDFPETIPLYTACALNRLLRQQ